MKVSSNYYLLRYSGNWSDEMDIEAYLALNQKQYEDWKSRFDKIKFPVTVFVGTNEDVAIEKNDITIKKIKKTDFDTLVRLGLDDIGHTNCIDIEYDESCEEE